jgi:RimJ/RimL family protein N-acetyltransferase
MRPLRLEDWPSVHEWAQREEVCRFQPWGPNSANETQLFVAGALADSAKQPRTRFVWSLIMPDGRVVGIAELKVSSAVFRRSEISYTVHPDCWGQGYGTRMASSAVQFAFGELGMHRVEATCDPRNKASAAVLRKVGMTHEGRLRQRLKIRDGWRDSELFSILENEWADAATVELVPRLDEA